MPIRVRVWVWVWVGHLFTSENHTRLITFISVQLGLALEFSFNLIFTLIGVFESPRRDYLSLLALLVYPSSNRPTYVGPVGCRSFSQPTAYTGCRSFSQPTAYTAQRNPNELCHICSGRGSIEGILGSIGGIWGSMGGILGSIGGIWGSMGGILGSIGGIWGSMGGIWG